MQVCHLANRCWRTERSEADSKWVGQPRAKRGGRRSDGVVDHQLPSSISELLEPNGKGAPEVVPRRGAGGREVRGEKQHDSRGIGFLPVPLAAVAAPGQGERGHSEPALCCRPRTAGAQLGLFVLHVFKVCCKASTSGLRTS